jgi:signal transduction histidine kinase
MLTMAQVHGAARESGPIDAASLVREVLAGALDLARDRGVELELDERARPTLWGAHDALRLIVKNAVDNAVRHGGRGGVTVRVFEDRGDALIQVDDRGPGLSPEFIDQAFEPFRRMSPGEEGAGLGLAIAADAARKLSGTIVLRNREDGAGLSFIYRQRLAPRATNAAAA